MIEEQFVTQLSQKLADQICELLANSIEEILCLSTLIANGELAPNATITDSSNFYEKETGEDCDKCPFCATCLACIINE